MILALQINISTGFMFKLSEKFRFSYNHTNVAKAEYGGDRTNVRNANDEGWIFIEIASISPVFQI